MPTYEYRCEQCHRRNAYSVRGFNPPEAPLCPHCGSTVQKRVISRVAVMRSEDARLDALADPDSLGQFDENDPRSVARMMRHMSDESGEEMPPEVGEMVDRLESGESPESIEASMGDQPGGPPGGDMAGGDDFM